jgi:hypothetical protein
MKSNSPNLHQKSFDSTLLKPLALSDYSGGAEETNRYFNFVALSTGFILIYRQQLQWFFIFYIKHDYRRSVDISI